MYYSLSLGLKGDVTPCAIQFYDQLVSGQKMPETMRVGSIVPSFPAAHTCAFACPHVRLQIRCLPLGPVIRLLLCNIATGHITAYTANSESSRKAYAICLPSLGEVFCVRRKPLPAVYKKRAPTKVDYQIYLSPTPIFTLKLPASPFTISQRTIVIPPDLTAISGPHAT